MPDNHSAVGTVDGGRCSVGVCLLLLPLLLLLSRMCVCVCLRLRLLVLGSFGACGGDVGGGGASYVDAAALGGR